MNDMIYEFIDFLHKSDQIESMMFQLNQISYPDGSKMKMNPVGEYFIYQQNAYQFKFWSYNLQELREIVDKEGGMVTDKNNKLLYIKYP